jgi:hypothetical protein
MTDKIKALNALLAKVEAGSIDPKRSIPEFAVMFETFSTAQLPICVSAFRAYHGSLDAAKALHESVLPRNDKGPAVYINDDDLPTRWYVSIYNNAMLIGEGEHESNPARAWLIAIIKALIAEAKP